MHWSFVDYFYSLNYAYLGTIVKYLICQYHYQSQEYSLKVLRISLWWILLLPDYNFQMKARILLLAISLTVFFK